MADEVAEVDQAQAETPRQRSYFNTNKLNRVVLNDGLSYIEHKLIDEGTYEMFQDLTSSVKLDANANTTEVDLGLGRSRKFLLETLVVGWNLVDEADNPIPFEYKKLMELPPSIIHKVIEDVYDKNDVLRADSELGKDSSKN